MSIASELSRLSSDRNTIRAKLVELGLSTSTANLTALAAVIEDIINQGAVSVTVREGETYTIPAGYHNGSGTVSGVSGGGNYALQSKTVTPTKKQQSVTADSGYYGLSDVTVAAIPENYQDVSSVNAAAENVLTGKVFVLSDGTVTTGTMPNNGAVSGALSATVVTYTIPKGYHDGTGKVTITLETKTVTPTKETQTVTASSGKVLSDVVVNPIPDNFQDISVVTAEAGDVKEGKSFVSADGTVTAGTMPVNVAEAIKLRYNSGSYTIPEGYHDGTGTVGISFASAKTVTPTKSQQTVNPPFGYVLSTVVVSKIPDKYQDVSGVTAAANTVLEGSTFVDSEGNEVEGLIPSISENYTIDGLSATSVTIPEGFHSGSTVSLTDDIEKALAAI